MKSPSRCPEAASITRPDTSVDRLYSCAVAWRAGLAQQRHRSQAGDLLGGAQITGVEVDVVGLAQPGLSQSLLERGVVADLAVPQARRVPKQVLHGHRSRRLGAGAGAGGGAQNHHSPKANTFFGPKPLNVPLPQ